MKSQGLDVPLMGGDGIFDPKYIELAGATSEGDLATSVGAPTDSTEAGKKFLDQYKTPATPTRRRPTAATPTTRPTRSSTPSRSASRTPERQGRPRQHRHRLGKVSFDGVTGKVAFDEFGDTTTKVLTVYKVDGGKPGSPRRPTTFK
jgi:branched-chain amino acid transport system substrate-binding protein